MAWNLSAAIPYMVNPDGSLHSFQVSGIGGASLIRGLGILFLMWQVPYIPVLIHPAKHRVAFLCILAMQLIGIVGESLMLWHLPDGNPGLFATGTRFLTFDTAGLVLLVIGYLIVRGIKHQDLESSS
ncbi:MAG: hypothetical protein ABFQ89_00565 [Chloroflexota bacterium]